jgi:hypothetical protein
LGLPWFEKGVEGIDESRTFSPQLCNPLPSYQLYQLRAGRLKSDQNAAPVLTRAIAADQAASFQAVHQFHSAVMLQRQPFRQDCYGGMHWAGKALNRQQELILLRFKPGMVSGGITGG